MTVNIAIAEVRIVIVGQVEWSRAWGPTKSKPISNRVRNIVEPRVIPSRDYTWLRSQNRQLRITRHLRIVWVLDRCGIARYTRIT